MIEGLERLMDRLNAWKESIPLLVEEAILDNENDILTNVKDSLWNGKSGSGEDLMPFVQDPFFKTTDQAIGYMNWKNAIAPNPNRNPASPNLYINGYFYSTLEVDVSGGEMTVTSKDNLLGIDVIRKYGVNTFGVTDAFYKDVLRPEIINKLIQRV